MTLQVAHLINRMGPGGAERQLAEIVRRSRLRSCIRELGEHSPRRLIALRQELRKHESEVHIGWLDRSQIALASVVGPRTTLVASVAGSPWRGRHRLMLRAALTRCSHLVTNSDTSKETIEAFLGRLSPPIKVIPNGVDPAVPAANGNRPGGSLQIGFIGRANRDKGIDVLLSALSNPELRDVQATLIGTDVPKAVEAHRAALPFLHYRDAVADPWAVAGPLDALVVPSRTEGSPNVVLEAFVRGIPVIATSVGGTPELIGADRGTLVPSEDPGAIARAVTELRANPEAAASQAERARAYAVASHRWDSVVDSWDDLLIGLMGRANPSLFRAPRTILDRVKAPP